ncbi:AraC family transcriptional regulator [Microbaculum marinum]|uniref:AraC family transcriptional regulator n=1 Tax=Microbaculum marinum TaxID=1764581 RepID=A0AAW9RF49_9HYPH
MRQVPLVRAAHFNLYLSVLREIGVPVWDCLTRAGLPATTEESPDLYLSLPRIMDFVAQDGGAGGAMELGFMAAQRATLRDLRPEFRQAILNAQSGFALLQTFLRYRKGEDTAAFSAIYPEGASVRVVCDQPGLEHTAGFVCTEWMNLQAVVSIVRCIAGAAWTPEEVTFVSDFAPHDRAKEAFPNTRMLMSQIHTSVLVPRDVLARPSNSPVVPETGDCEEHAEISHSAGPLDTIREIVKPYFREKPLLLLEVAEILGMSQRTLQRQLNNMGVSYSRLVAEARYQVACDLLANLDIKITDIAIATGYQNPSHFSRAFRRFAGLSPIEYRMSASAQ